MWNVFLWLNICYIAVFCQRSYIPHYSYYIKSLLQPKLGIAPYQRISRGSMPLNDRYTNYLRSFNSHSKNLSENSLQHHPLLNHLSNNLKAYQTPKKYNKRDGNQPEYSLPFIVNQPEAYIFYKGVAPIPLKFAKITKFIKPCHKISEKRIMRKYPLIPQTTSKGIINKKNLIADNNLSDNDCTCYSLNNNNFITRSASEECSCTPVENSTEPLAINVFLPSQLIINNLHVFCPTQAYGEVRADVSGFQFGYAKGAMGTTKPTPPDENVIVINISLPESQILTEKNRENEIYYSTPFQGNYRFLNAMNLNKQVNTNKSNSYEKMYSGFIKENPDERQVSTKEEVNNSGFLPSFNENKSFDEIQNLPDTSTIETEVLFEEDINKLFQSATTTEGTVLANMPEEIISYLIEGLKHVYTLNPETMTEVDSYKPSQYKLTVEYPNNLSINIPYGDQDASNQNYQFSHTGKKPTNNNILASYNKSDNENELVRPRRRTNAWLWRKKRKKKKREFVSGVDYSTKASDMQNIESDIHNDYYQTSQPLSCIYDNKYKSDQNDCTECSPVKICKNLVCRAPQAEIYGQKRMFVSGSEDKNSTRTENEQQTNRTTRPTTLSTKSTIAFRPTMKSPVPIMTPRTESTANTQFILDTGNRHPSKMECEQTTNMDCICCLRSALADLSDMAANQSGTAGISSYSCSDYRPLNASYMLASDLKPRLITKKLKALIPDNKSGPKEITADTFKELLNRGVPNEGADYYIFPSTSITIPCFTRDDILLSPNTADSAKYDWRHSDDRPITEGRVREDRDHRGQLEVSAATGMDSDSYKCTVSYINPDTEETVQSTFIHSLFVVELPKFVLQTPLHYGASVKCDQETIEMFELYLPQQVEELVCSCEGPKEKACTVDIHNPICQGKVFQVRRRDPKVIWHLESGSSNLHDETSEVNEDANMEMYLTYQVDISDVNEVMRAEVNKTKCNPFCQLKILLKMADIVRDSMVVALSHPVKSGTGVTFSPDLTSMNMKLLIACGGGLQLYQGFCIPCPANTFSEEGSTGCTPCPDGTHQPQVGSKSCEKCTSLFDPGCKSIIFKPPLLIWFIIGLIAVPAVLIIICRKIFVPNKKHKGTLERDSSRGRHIKDRRPKPRKYIYSSDDSSGPPSLPSEDFTE